MRALFAVPILLLVFASGFSSLLYQVLWAREFGVILGNTVQSVSTVLAAFMGGLGLGGIFWGAFLDRKHFHPLKVYAGLEAGIAAAGLLVELALGVAPYMYGPLYDFQQFPGLFYITRFLLVFSLLWLPPFFMGGTLPALAKLITREGRVGIQAGWLYGLNTLGAASGAFATGFVLIERIGLNGTLLIAVLVNTLIAVFSFLLSQKIGHTAELRSDVERAQGVGKTASASLGLILYTVSGFVSLGLEVAWSRTLVFSIGATTYAFTLMVVVTLAGLAMGSVLAIPVTRRSQRLLTWIAGGHAVVALLSILGPWLFITISLPMKEWLSLTEDIRWQQRVMIQFLVAVPLLLPSAAIFGAIFPLAADLYVRSSAVGTRIGLLLGANTFSAIAGALLTGFIFIPTFGIHRTYIILGTVAFLALMYVTLRMRSGKTRLAATAVLVGTWIVLVRIVPAHTTLEPLLPTEKLLFYKEGPNGTISVIEDYSGNRNLLIDHIAVAGTDPVFMTDQKSLAHLPMLLHTNPKKVLTVGFGSGGASYSFTRYRELEAIHAVEIDPVVLEAAPYFKFRNGDPLADPRFRVIRDDVRSYLLYGRESYDIITTDCTDLRYKSNALLYTREFFEAVKRKLNPGGLIVAWVPLGGLSEDNLKTAIRTFAVSFTQSSAWYMYNYPTHYLLLVGTMSGLRFDLKQVEQRMGQPEVQGDLAEIGLANPLKVLASYFKDHSQLLAFTEGARINSDAHPHLEFSVPKSPNALSISENLEEFARETANVHEMVSGAVSMEAILRARRIIVEGHVVYNKGSNQYAAALTLYQRAQKLDPADSSLTSLISAARQTALDKKAEYERLAVLRSWDYKVFNELGLLKEDAGDLRGAREAFLKAIELAQERPEVYLNLGRISELQHNWQESEEAYRAALGIDSQYADAWNNLGIVYLEQGKNPDAVSAFQKAAALKNRHTTWFNLGLAAFRNADLARARLAFDQALQLNPYYAEAYMNRGVLRLTNKDVDGALSDLVIAAKHNPNSAEVHYNLGIVEEERKQYADAAIAYQRAIELDPKYVLAYNNLGILYSLARQPRLAIETYLYAIAIEPTNSGLRNNVAMEYARIGNFGEAIVQYKKAIELEPGKFEPYANLAVIYRKRNQMPLADRYLAEARKLNPNLR